VDGGGQLVPGIRDRRLCAGAAVSVYFRNPCLVHKRAAQLPGAVRRRRVDFDLYRARADRKRLAHARHRAAGLGDYLQRRLAAWGVGWLTRESEGGEQKDAQSELTAKIAGK